MLDQPESSESIASQRLLWCLRVVVFLQCIGVGGRYYLSANEVESDIYGYLFFDNAWPESTAQRIDDVGTLACLGAGCVVALAALFRSFWSRVVETLAATLIGAWMLSLAISHMLRGDVYSELSLGEHAVRYAAPLTLALLAVRGSNRFSLALATIVLTLASSATFIVHGYKACEIYGPFVDLILLSAANWTRFDLEQSHVETSLRVIGVIDIMAAAAIATLRWRWIALYMFAWGAISAASRLTALGSVAWPELLIRSANWGVPLCVAILIGHRLKHRDTEHRSTDEVYEKTV